MKVKSLDSQTRHQWLVKETGWCWLAEFQFCDGRRWRADHACPSFQILIEVDGGIWTGGRHSRGKGQEADNEKLNTAAVFGWYVLRYSTQQFSRGEWIEDVKALAVRVINERKAK